MFSINFDFYLVVYFASKSSLLFILHNEIQYLTLKYINVSFLKFIICVVIGGHVRPAQEKDDQRNENDLYRIIYLPYTIFFSREKS